MARIFSTLLMVVVILLGLGFAQINADEVVLHYYFGKVSVPLSLLLALTLGLGVLLGILTSAAAIYRVRRENARLQRQMKLREEELMNLRSIPLKDIG